LRIIREKALPVKCVWTGFVYVGGSNDRRQLDVTVYRNVHSRVTGGFQGLVYCHEVVCTAILSDLQPKYHDTALTLYRRSADRFI